MRDKVSQNRVALLHPAIRGEVANIIDAVERDFPKHIAVRIAQGLRSKEDQDALYAQGRTKPGSIVTNARFGASYHNYGLAIDFCLLYDNDRNGTYEFASWDIKADKDVDKIADWMEVVMMFKSYGYTWGGDFKSITDNPHLEKSFGYHWKQLLRKFNKKDFIPGTQYVIL
jgi:peptidoglycan L-alanyl-D-glutamate endopeptidase CwlK